LRAFVYGLNSLKKSDSRPSNSAAGKAAVAARIRRRRPSPSNDQLLDKAFELFVELGYDRTSLEAITAAAGLAKRTVYVRYKDKEKLFIASVQRAIEKWILPVETLREAESADLEGTLVTIGRLLLQNVLSPSGLRLLQLTNAVSRQHPEIGAHSVEQGTKPTLHYLADLFDRRLGSQFQCVADSAGAAMAFMNLVVSGPANFVVNGALLDRNAIEQDTVSSVRLFLHGVLPPKDNSGPGLVEENQRLKLILAETMMQLDAARRGSRSGRGAQILTPAAPSGSDKP
jgi:TetR/AcrR family transcriptional repressor of mexJK operon